MLESEVRCGECCTHNVRTVKWRFTPLIQGARYVIYADRVVWYRSGKSNRDFRLGVQCRRQTQVSHRELTDPTWRGLHPLRLDDGHRKCVIQSKPTNRLRALVSLHVDFPCAVQKCLIDVWDQGLDRKGKSSTRVQTGGTQWRSVQTKL